MQTTTFFIDNQFYGSQSFRPLRVSKIDAFGLLLNSKVYICPTCGEAWARRLVTNQDGSTQPWEVRPLPCPRHGTGLLCEGYLDYPEAMPRELLKREINILSKESINGSEYFIHCWHYYSPTREQHPRS